MLRRAIAFSLSIPLLSMGSASAAPGVRDLGRWAASHQQTSPMRNRQALHREALLDEISLGQRKLFAHDPKAKTPGDAKNQFLIVRDMMASPGREHALGILTPTGREQPKHISEVPRSDAASLGRMLRSLLVADRASEHAPKGGYKGWDVYVNIHPAVPRLHVHGQEGSSSKESIADFDAFARGRGYTLEKDAGEYRVWSWKGSGSAPHGWSALVVGDKRFGGAEALGKLPAKQADKVDALLGTLWIEAAHVDARGYQIEASRGDGQLVARVKSF